MNPIPSYKNIHNRFKLNGNSLCYTDLFEVAYSLIKEGESYERIIGDFLMDWINPNEYIILQTSGSTDKPKQIKYSKQSMVNSALATGNHFGISIGSIALNCLSANNIAGKMMLVRAMILGLELDIVPPNGNVLEGNIKKYDFAAMVPLQVDQAMNQINQIKTLLVGGAIPSNFLIKALQSKEIKSFITYGMTETLTHIASKSINLNESYYTVLPGIEISADHRKCLNIKASYLSNELIITNDLVKLISKTTFEILGRYDNVINSGGIKVSPEEVEQKIDHLIESPFFIGSISDEKLGEKMVLVLEGENKKSDILSILKHKEILSLYKLPKAVVYIKSFEYTENGKLRRAATLAKLEARPY
tara:strand:- start:2807 stop:3889 length:1083 start_codon:yes stop_codon:yes gene_type:complete